MAHVEHAPSGLANYRKGFFQNLVENFLQSFVLLFFKLLLLIDISTILRFRFGRVSRRTSGNAAQPLLNALAEPVRFRAQFGVAELLDLRLERVDRLHPAASTI